MAYDIVSEKLVFANCRSCSSCSDLFGLQAGDFLKEDYSENNGTFGKKLTTEITEQWRIEKMKETMLRAYFEDEIAVEILAADLSDSQEKTGYDTTAVYIDQINDGGEYELTRQHLLKLCDCCIGGHLTPTDLNTVAFALMISEYFTWGNDDPADYEIIERTLFDWDNPDISHPLTLDNFKRWREFLLTGEYNLGDNELKRKKRNTRHNNT